MFVLDPKLQDGKKLPRWEPRSKLGQFLGRSKVHAGTVGLIRNVVTGKVSSQFHVVYDENFTTMKTHHDEDNDIIPEDWKNLFIYNRETTYDPDDNDTTSESAPIQRRVLFPPSAQDSPSAPEGAPDSLRSPSSEGGRDSVLAPNPFSSSPSGPLSDQSPTPSSSPLPPQSPLGPIAPPSPPLPITDANSPIPPALR